MARSISSSQSRGSPSNAPSNTRYTHSPSSRLIVQPLPQQPSTGNSKFHTNALRLKGCDEATVVMRRDECRMPRTETEMQNDRFQPASTHERWVKYLGLDFTPAIPPMFRSDSETSQETGQSNCIPLYHEDHDYRCPPAPARRARCVPLPNVDAYPSPSAETEGRSHHSSRTTSPVLEVEAPVPRCAYRRAPEKRTTAPEAKTEPVKYDKFRIWLTSVLGDLYPPNRVAQLRDDLLSMPLYPNEFERQIIESILPYNIHILFNHRRQSEERSTNQFFCA